MNMAFSLTKPQMRARTKDVTRRLGWRHLQRDQITFEGIQNEDVADNDHYFTIRSKSGFRELDGRQWNEFPKVP
jgi:hypothetical protein